jgi:thioredoxin 1
MKKLYILSALFSLFVIVVACAKGEAAGSGTVVEPRSVAEVLDNAGKSDLTLVELGSVNCRPCVMMTPVLKSVAARYKDRLQVVFFDVWKNQDPAQHFQIRVIPVQVMLDRAGKEVWRNEGYIPEDRLAAVIEGLLPKGGS